MREVKQINKDIRKSIRFTEEEFAHISILLEDSSQSFSNYTRNVLLGKEPKNKKVTELILHYQKTEGVLRQIADKVSSNMSSETSSEIISKLIDIEAQLKKGIDGC